MPTKKDDVYGDHISHKFNNELMELKTEFLKMGGMVEAQVENAIQALVDGDGHMADEIRANDKKVDKMEVEIDEEATLIIARRQPTARDLRLVISVIKMVADLERVGDEAKKIAKLPAPEVQKARTIRMKANPASLYPNTINNRLIHEIP